MAYFIPPFPRIILTHQLNIKTNLGKWSENWLQKRNYKYINRFTECWVPDEEGENNLAGELSHPKTKPIIPIRYIGPLSRFKKATELSDSSPGAGNLLILISGPEPQRTILENKIIKDIAHYNGAATVIRGLPGNLNLIPSTNTIRFYNHLPAEALNKEMNKAEYIISRSGYSTIMDIRRLQKKGYSYSDTRANRTGISCRVPAGKKDGAGCFSKVIYSLFGITTSKIF